MIKKAFIGIIIFVVIILGIAIILPIFFKDRIQLKITDEINKNINADVSFRDVNLSLLRNFPNISISIKELKVVGMEEFREDTLANINALNITVDLFSVIKGNQIKIKSIELDKPNILAKVLKDGKTNWDIMKSSTDTAKATEESSGFKMVLQKYTIDDAKIVYDDASTNFWMEMNGLQHMGKGDFTADLFTLNTQTEADFLSVSYDGIKYLNKVKAEIMADIEVDMKISKYTFKNNEISLNDLDLGIDGYLAMPKEDIQMDIKFKAKQNDFKNFLSLLPAVYSKDFKDVKAAGKLGFEGFVRGIMGDKSTLAFKVDLIIKDGMFQYPDLPTAINNVTVDLKVENPDGNPDHTIINLSKMHFEFGKDPFDAKLRVSTPVSNLQVDASLKGKINLSNVQQLIPLEKGTQISGLITSDVTLKGKMSSIEQKKYEEFQSVGNIVLQNIIYVDKEMPKGVNLRKMELTFNPRNIVLSSFDAVLGNSDIQMNGTLDNLLGYYFKDEMLKGTLNLNSRLIDLNEFSSESATGSRSESADTSTLSVIEIPSKVDFVMTARVGKMLYDNLVLNNVSGGVLIKDKVLKMSALSMETLDGKILVDGVYDTKNTKKPHISFDLNISDFDIQKTFKTFITVQKLAPIAEYCYGKFSSQVKSSGYLNNRMEPELTTLAGQGNLRTKQVSIQNFEPFNKVADVLKLDKLKRQELKDVNISFKFSDGQVYVDPFYVNIGNIKTQIQGSNGFDQSINYVMNMEIPKSELGSQANNVINNLISQANTKGADFSVGEKINVDVVIGGTVAKPTVKTGFKGMAEDVVEDIKSQVQGELEEKKQELEAKAKAEADKFKKEAEAKLKSEQEKAKAEAERLKREAEAKAKAEADRLKKEAENKLKNIFKPK